MYVLQHYSQGVFSYMPFPSLADLFQYARGNYGLTEMQFLELIVLKTWGTDFTPFTLYWFEGEVPEFTMLKGSKAAGEAFRAKVAKR